MSDLNFFLEYGLTPEAFQIMTQAAHRLADSGDRDKLTFVLFNQVVNRCKLNGADYRAVFQEIIDELQARLDGPQTPDEFNAMYPEEPTR